MATHDYVLANASGAAFRTDLNNALAAIVSNNSNSSEPATKYAYQWWADTSASIFKIRNSSNDGWINLFTLAGRIDVDAASNFNEDVTFTGAAANIIFDKSDNALEFNDDAKALFGTGADSSIYHSGADFAITNTTGNLNILNNSADAVQIRHGSENMIKAISDGAVELYFDGATTAKLATLTNGVQVNGSAFFSEGTITLEKPTVHHHRILSNDTGNDLGFQQSSDTGANTNFTTYLRINDGGDISLPVDNQKLRIGASGDLELLHDGTDCLVRMEGGTGGDLILQTGSSDDDVFVKANDDFIVNVQGGAENAIIARNSAEVQLFYDGSTLQKFQTDNDGVKTIGRHQFANDSGTTGAYTQVFVSGTISDGGTFTATTFNTHAGGLVTITTNRRPSGSNNKNISIFPIVINSTSTATLGTALSSMSGSSGSSFSVAATSQGVIVTNTSGLDQRITVRYDITG